MDQHFRVELGVATPSPQRVMYAAMHQDYSEEFVSDEGDRFPSESRAGELCVKRLLQGDRGHWGPLEHPQITLNCGWFPHSVIQQARTHRISISFDCQSSRYTGQRIIDVTTGKRDIEKVFYLRPIGFYSDRQGKRYEYTVEQRQEDLEWCLAACHRYKIRIQQGLSEEHARGLIPFDVRQHWVVSFNARSLMHFLDLRAKSDAQLEIRQLCDLIWPHFEAWMPEIAQWYKTNRWKKARLAP